MYRVRVPREPMTAAEAAATLGVSVGRVRQLADRGQLVKVNHPRQVLVSRSSVAERLAASPGRGRPWSTAVVWAAAWLLDGREPSWLNERTLRRLRVGCEIESRQSLLVRLQPSISVTRWAAVPGDLEAIRVEAGNAWHRDAAGVLTVCLPRVRAEALPGRYGLALGSDLVVVGTTGFRACPDIYVPSVLL